MVRAVPVDVSVAAEAGADRFLTVQNCLVKGDPSADVLTDLRARFKGSRAYSNKSLAQIFDERCKALSPDDILVAYDNQQQPVGMCRRSLMFNRDKGQKLLHIDLLWVQEDCRGQGVGKALLQRGMVIRKPKDVIVRLAGREDGTGAGEKASPVAAGLFSSMGFQWFDDLQEEMIYRYRVVQECSIRGSPTVDDLAGIKAQLKKLGHSKKFLADTFEDRCKQLSPDDILVAYDGKQAVGMIRRSLKFNKRAGKVMVHVDFLWVQQDCRGQGIGRDLLQRGMVIGRKPKDVFLRVAGRKEGNPTAVALYLSMGFQWCDDLHVDMIYHPPAPTEKPPRIPQCGACQAGLDSELRSTRPANKALSLPERDEFNVDHLWISPYDEPPMAEGFSRQLELARFNKSLLHRRDPSST